MKIITGNRPALGIIGGGGVAATNLLATKIEEFFIKRGAFRDNHQPEIVTIQATGVMSPSMFLEGRRPSFLNRYFEISQSLEEIGVTLLAMPCNTAHYYFGEIAASTNVPMINMIEETIRRIEISGAKKIGLLASESCLAGAIYQNAIVSQGGYIEFVLPNSEGQKHLNSAIVNTKSIARLDNENSERRPARTYLRLIESFINVGCDAIVLGSTDIAVDFNFCQKFDLPIIDSLSVLAESCCNRLLEQWSGNTKAKIFYRSLAAEVQSPLDTKNKSRDGSDFDAKLIRSFSDPSKRLLDFGAGTGLVVNKISDFFESILAVERHPEFSRYIEKKHNVQIVNCDLLEFKTDKKFSVVTIIGVLNYMGFYEAVEILNKAKSCMDEDGVLIIKHQMGQEDTVIIDQVSNKLGKYYFSEYRHVCEEIALVKNAGFSSVECIDIYPPEYNEYSNTHYYALVARK